MVNAPILAIIVHQSFYSALLSPFPCLISKICRLCNLLSSFYLIRNCSSSKCSCPPCNAKITLLRFNGSIGLSDIAFESGKSFILCLCLMNGAISVWLLCFCRIYLSILCTYGFCFFDRHFGSFWSSLYCIDVIALNLRLFRIVGMNLCFFLCVNNHRLVIHFLIFNALTSFLHPSPKNG